MGRGIEPRLPDRLLKINFILDIGNGKVEELISYDQLLEHLENAQDHDMGMDQVQSHHWTQMSFACIRARLERKQI